MFINILLILFAGMIISGCLGKKSCNDFLCKRRTDSIKGAAATMIVFAHILSFSPWLSQKLIGGGYTDRILSTWGGVGVALFFILSGFGCWFSTTKIVKDFRAAAKWLVRHVGRILVFYFMALAVVIALRTVVYHIQIDAHAYAENFVTLTIPGTSTWYLKIQLLFYIFIAISIMAKKEYRWIVLCALTMAYAITARSFCLPDYWWKTSTCFSVGYMIADRSVVLAGFLKKKMSIMIMLAAAGISFIGILLDGKYIFLLQLILWPLLAASMILIAQRLKFENVCFQFIGVSSFSLYLVHIGVVGEGMRNESSVGIGMFIITITIGSFAAEFLARKIWGALLR